MGVNENLKSKLSTDHLIFKGLRNKVTQLRKARANFFLNIISDAKVNCKKLWKSIDKLLGKEKSPNRSVQLMMNVSIQNDNHIVGKCFNDYFINSVQYENSVGPFQKSIFHSPWPVTTLLLNYPQLM